MFPDVCFLLMILIALKIKLIGAFQLNMEEISVLTIKRELEKNGEEIIISMRKQVPDWVQDLVLLYYEAALELVLLYKAELYLLCLMAGTLAVMQIISRCFNQKKWEVPLVKKIAEIDRNLFVANAEIASFQREVVETAEAGRKEGEKVKLLNVQVENLEKELTVSKEEVKTKKEIYRSAETQLELVKDKVISIDQDIARNKKKIKDLLEVKNEGEKSIKENEEIVIQLEEKVNSQKVQIENYKSNMVEKVEQTDKLSEELETVQEELNHIKSHCDSVFNELIESNIAIDTLALRVSEMEEKEEEWKVSSDLIQSQLDNRSEECEKLESELSCLGSRIVLFESECESKDEELQILNEALEEEFKNKNGDSVEADGWDLDEDCLVGVDLKEVKKEAELKIENKKNAETNKILAEKLEELKSKFAKVNQQVTEVITKNNNIREGKESAIKHKVEAERKLEILTDYFSKKEEELLKKLGNQSSKVENVSSDAEVAARRLASVSSQLEIAKSQLNILSRELEDQENIMKSAFMEAEKKAHENWIAARQAERRVAETHKEMASLRNRLTVAEGKKENLAAVICKQKQELVTTEVPSSLPPLPGLPSISSFSSLIPPGLPSLPSLPGLSLPPLPSMAGMFSVPPDHDMSFMSSNRHCDERIHEQPYSASTRSPDKSSHSEQSRHGQGHNSDRYSGQAQSDLRDTYRHSRHWVGGGKHR